MTHSQSTCTNRIAFRAGKNEARLAGVRALALGFDKSATEFKLKQKLRKCKRTIQITTFNIRTLNRIGQLSAIYHNIYIIYILIAFHIVLIPLGKV